jgi:hypothetical protein
MDAVSVRTVTMRLSPRAIYGSLAVLFGALAAALIAPGGGWHALPFAPAPALALLSGKAPGLARGQLHPRAVPINNAVHGFAGPLALGPAALRWLGVPWLVGSLAWGPQSAVNRALGYGQRTREGFRNA